jgi:ubiquinone/menaquinone biosynthesis C-methylase UbiE
MVSTPAGGSVATTDVVLRSVVGSVRWTLDRMVAIGYGMLYDSIFERFTPYQSLKTEVLALMERAVPPGVPRRDVQVLDVACGPGNMAVTLAEAGFSVVGVDPYAALVELAREKRRARHLANVAFRHGDLAAGHTFKARMFDQVVSIHSLYLHPAPRRLLQEAQRVLKPGGHALFVNRTRPLAQLSTVREVYRRDGAGAALQSLLWVVPNSIFEATRKQVGPHYWNADEFGAALADAGFTVLELRPTFLNDSSLLALVRKDDEG